MHTNDRLLFNIENKREEMISAASRTGMLSTETLVKSRELDDLINIYFRKQSESAKYLPGLTN